MYLGMVIFSRSLSLWYNNYYAEKTNVSLCAHPILYPDLLLL